MNGKREIVLFCIISIIFWMIVIILYQWTVLEMINNSFLTGLIGLIFVSIIIIVNSSFMHPLVLGFRKISNSFSRRSNAMKRVDKQIKNSQYIQPFKRTINRLLLTAVLSFSAISISFSIIGLIIYYF